MTNPRERQIIFNADEVRATLAGDKTQHRMPVKYQPYNYKRGIFPYPFGDLLYVRETWGENVPGCPNGLSYKADHIDPKGDGNANPMKWQSPATMPKGCARIWLRVTGVRVERLQEISVDDAIAEGMPEPDDTPLPKACCPTCFGEGVYAGLAQNLGVTEVDCRDCDTEQKIFMNLWNARHADKGFSWDSNPWVWVIEFERYDK